MTSAKKFIALLIMPLCFMWFAYTCWLFWQDLMIWRNMVAPGPFVFYAFLFFLGRNVLTLFGLMFIYYWYEKN